MVATPEPVRPTAAATAAAIQKRARRRRRRNGEFHVRATTRRGGEKPLREEETSGDLCGFRGGVYRVQTDGGGIDRRHRRMEEARGTQT